jgi:hypothetical protein
MKRKLTVWVLVVAMVLSLGVFAPRRAQASTTTDIIIYSAIGVGAAIAIVLIATYFTRDDNTLFLTQPPLNSPERRFLDTPKPRVQFGAACKRADGSISLVCW